MLLAADPRVDTAYLFFIFHRPLFLSLSLSLTLFFSLPFFLACFSPRDAYVCVSTKGGDTRAHGRLGSANARGTRANLERPVHTRSSNVFTNTSSPSVHVITARYRERSCHRTFPNACPCVGRWRWFVNLLTLRENDDVIKWDTRHYLCVVKPDFFKDSVEMLSQEMFVSIAGRGRWKWTIQFRLKYVHDRCECMCRECTNWFTTFSDYNIICKLLISMHS